MSRKIKQRAPWIHKGYKVQGRMSPFPTEAPVGDHVPYWSLCDRVNCGRVELDDFCISALECLEIGIKRVVVREAVIKLFSEITKAEPTAYRVH